VRLPSVPGVVMVSGPLDEATADEAVAALVADVGERRDTVTLHVTNVTGSVAAALALHDVIRQLGVPVHTIGAGMLDTAGAIVLTAGTAGHRRLLPSARIHLRQPVEPSVADLPLEVAAKDVAYLRERAEELLATPLHPPRMVGGDEAARLGIVDPAPGE
jgi:ATP-dependent Clp protease protease subunit